jgi:hypothetical protein
MTGFAQSVSHPGIVCSICDGSVPLETSKTDERGKAVHEECYVRTLISKFRIPNLSRRRENWLSSIFVRFQNARGTVQDEVVAALPSLRVSTSLSACSQSSSALPSVRPRPSYNT